MTDIAAEVEKLVEAREQIEDESDGNDDPDDSDYDPEEYLEPKKKKREIQTIEVSQILIN